MSNREEKEKAWKDHESFWKNGNIKLSRKDWIHFRAGFDAGVKAGQEEIDRLSDVITISNRHNDDQYAKKNEIILALENRLEEKEEELESKKSLFLSMSKKQRDDKDLIDRLRAEREDLKEHIDRLTIAFADHESEIHRLKDLVKRAKPWAKVYKYEGSFLGMEQWLKDSEVIGE